MADSHASSSPAPQDPQLKYVPPKNALFISGAQGTSNYRLQAMQLVPDVYNPRKSTKSVVSKSAASIPFSAVSLSNLM